MTIDGKHYINERVSLPELARPSCQLEGYTFEECELDGPAVLMLFGDIVMVGNAHFPQARFEQYLWPALPDDIPPLLGGILVRDCRFLRCTLNFIGMTTPARAHADLERHMRGGQIGWN
ncbi:hypothetical protein FDO65_10215 [Nakamurella flava]|uniref:Uncharacterized protein n=1 Tax=Nakamurella flava TaxID=2576308 RepID=A0A4U6QNA5_9ACTN|nr:hypothetical protein [Nakamurella flava]TKV61889.1 hypothetical protein FDO65_10215 [Nakamurella flava]